MPLYKQGATHLNAGSWRRRPRCPQSKVRRLDALPRPPPRAMRHALLRGPPGALHACALAHPNVVTTDVLQHLAFENGVCLEVDGEVQAQEQRPRVVVAIVIEEQVLPLAVIAALCHDKHVWIQCDIHRETHVDDVDGKRRVPVHVLVDCPEFPSCEERTPAGSECSGEALRQHVIQNEEALLVHVMLAQWHVTRLEILLDDSIDLGRVRVHVAQAEHHLMVPRDAANAWLQRNLLGEDPVVRLLHDVAINGRMGPRHTRRVRNLWWWWWLRWSCPEPRKAAKQAVNKRDARHQGGFDLGAVRRDVEQGVLGVQGVLSLRVQLALSLRKTKRATENGQDDAASHRGAELAKTNLAIQQEDEPSLTAGRLRWQCLTKAPVQL